MRSTPRRSEARARGPRSTNTSCSEATPSCSTTSATTRALAVAVVASTGTARPLGGKQPDQVPDAAVVRPEVVAPVGDAVGLVHHEQAHARHEVRQLLVPEPGVREALGRDQQHVHLVRREPSTDLVPLRGVRRAHGHRAHARPGGGRDLVPHEREQRGDDQRGPRAAGTQQEGGHEVHGGLAPAGALHHQGAAAVGHERLDRLELPVLESRIRPVHEPTQDSQGLLVQRGVAPRRGGLGEAGAGVGVRGGVHGVHGVSMPTGPDTAGAAGPCTGGMMGG